MNSLKDYISYIVNPHMYEKFIINHVNNMSQIYNNEYLITKVNVSFTLPPEQAVNNPFSVLTHKMFLELITGQKLLDHYSQRHINEFNLKKGQYIGSSVNLHRSNMFTFLQRLILINQLNVYNLRGFIQSSDIKNRTYSIGLKNLDAFEPVYSTFEKWALMPDHYKYGCYINIINSYENGLINEVLLSHLGLMCT